MHAWFGQHQLASLSLRDQSPPDNSVVQPPTLPHPPPGFVQPSIRVAASHHTNASYVRGGSGTVLRPWHDPLPATPSTAPSEAKAGPHRLLNSPECRTCDAPCRGARKTLGV